MTIFIDTERKKALVTQSCPTLCDPMDWSLTGSSAHGIHQARILEWAALPSPGGLPGPGIECWSPSLQADSLPSESPGKPLDIRKLRHDIKPSQTLGTKYFNGFLFTVRNSYKNTKQLPLWFHVLNQIMCLSKTCLCGQVNAVAKDLGLRAWVRGGWE